VTFKCFGVLRNKINQVPEWKEANGGDDIEVVG
jgi:hypothetical protein